MKKITAPQLKKIELLNNLIKSQNIALKNNLDMRSKVANNSLASLSGPGFGTSQATNPYFQTPITSFNPMLQNNIYAPITIDWTTMIYAYKTYGIVQALCDMPVLDALRGGITINSKELDEDEIDQIQDVMERKGVLDVIAEAQIWTRLFGGGALICSTDSPMDKPLDKKALAKTGEIEFYACNRWELASPWRVAKNYNFYGKTIDASKVMTMSGKTAPYILRWQLAGWGMSELERIIEEFNTYIRVKNVIYELLYTAKTDIFKFKDFASQMLAPGAEQQTTARMQTMNASRNYNSAILLDAEDDFDSKQVSFGGLADIYRESRIEMASALRMPMTKLFGISANGLNASSEDDIEIYNAMVESEVRRPLRKTIRKVLDILCVSLFGERADNEPYDIDFEFKPMRILSAKDEEEVKTSKFARLTGLYDRGLIDASELGELLSKEKLLDAEVDLLSDGGVEAETEDAADTPERSVFGDPSKTSGI